MLAHLFGNLVDNALTQGPRGAPVVVELRRENSASCVVTVHDQGGAIPPEAMAKLFDRFYRADSSRDRNSGGTGLGLAIARGIASTAEISR